MPYSNLALDADRKNGPAARSFPTGQARGLKAHADAYDCIMVRIKRSYRIQVCSARSAPKGGLPLGLSVGHAMRARSLVILPLRAQASRRCETQALLSGEPPSCDSVSVPRPLPRAPGTWSMRECADHIGAAYRRPTSRAPAFFRSAGTPRFPGTVTASDRDARPIWPKRNNTLPPCSKACWISLSTTQGTPSFLTPPSGLGISTRLTGCGW